MNCDPISFLVPNIGPAGLPMPMSAPALFDLECPEHPAHPAHRPDAAATEHAACTPDPGAIEYDSWSAYLRHAVR